MARCAAFLSALLLLSAASHSAAQVPGLIKNVSAVPMVLATSTGVELTQPSGDRGFTYPGECWRVDDQLAAAAYRGVGQVLVANVYQSWDCTAYAAACPAVDVTTRPGGSCARVVDVVGLTSTGWRGSAAPELRP
jgi:hypothetical protein